MRVHQPGAARARRPEAARLVAARPDGRAARRAGAARRSRWPGRRPRRRSRATAPRSCSRSTCRCRCRPPTSSPPARRGADRGLGLRRPAPARHQPRAGVVRGDRRGAGLAHHRPPADQARDRRAAARRVHGHRRRDPRGAAAIETFCRPSSARPARARRRPGSCCSPTASRPCPATRRRRQPRGAFTAARKAAEAEVPVSTISFGTDYGTIEHRRPPVSVAVDDDADAPDRRALRRPLLHRGQRDELRQVYADLGEQIGYEVRKVDTSRPWLPGRRADARRGRRARASGWADGCRSPVRP